MRLLPNFDRHKFNELKNLLAQMGLRFGMELPGFAHVANLRSKGCNNMCQSLNNSWSSPVVALGSAGALIIHDEEKNVNLYLKNLQMLWQLEITAGRPEEIRCFGREVDAAPAANILGA